MSITTKLQAIIDKANITTQEQDATVNDAVDSLIDEVASRKEIYNDGVLGLPYSDEIVIDVKQSYESAFANRANLYEGCKHLKKMTILGATTIPGRIAYNSSVEEINLPDATIINSASFANSDLKEIKKNDIPKVVQITQEVFNNCTKLKHFETSDTITTINAGAFKTNTSLETFKIYNKLTTFSTQTFGANLQKAFDLYVPWAEGEVSGAPWGAPLVTIHYNWTESDD